MTHKSTIKKLRRYQEIQESLKDDTPLGRGPSWVNPKHHPLPTLPELSHLEGSYLDQIISSAPHLIKDVRELISYIRRERGL